ncbi:hypothetical protein [Acinetobacter modestus]|uniref:hypothetical protein n=1 Tax=Acinetobacter modestus TaxID=1776740 RepID=UPI003016B3D3
MNNITAKARLIKSFKDLIIDILKLIIAIYLLFVELFETSKIFRNLIILLVLSILFMYLFKGALIIFDYEQIREMQALHVNK